VKINIPEVLLHLRGQVISQVSPLDPEALAMRQLSHIFASPKRYAQAQRLARRGQRFFMHAGVIDHLPGMLSGWSIARDLPPVPAQSFHDWWRQRKQEDQPL
jgi:L-lactate dehydrogenase complex protein LldF